VAKDISDRNRTSPLAFTGNKFEFRAVGSSQNCAESITAINLLVAYGYDEFYHKMKAMKGDAKSNAIMVLRDVLAATKKVRFEGNGYSQEWVEEARKRGLPNSQNTPEALLTYLQPEIIDLFSRYKVLSSTEINSKVEIKRDHYIKTLDIEFKTAIDLAETQIIPAIQKHILQVSQTCASLQEMKVSAEEMRIDLIRSHDIFCNIRQEIEELREFLNHTSTLAELDKKAKIYASKGINNLSRLRKAVDAAEQIVEKKLWPLANYQELLAEL
jgi:glutamine synthetase